MPQHTSLQEVRVRFYKAVRSARETQQLKTYIESIEGHYEPPLDAYQAAVLGLEGKHALNPITKYACVVKAVDNMNRAVARDEDNVESRFLRFAFFHQIPPVIGVDRIARQDIERVITMMENREVEDVPEQVLRDMREYMLASSALTRSQAKRLASLDEQR